MAEGRVTHIVGQAGRGHDLSYLGNERAQRLSLGKKMLGHIVAQRHAHTGHFERVGEAVMYEDAARQGEHLRLVLQSAERSRKDKPVVVALELRAIVMPLGMTMFLTETAVGYELIPVHNHGTKLILFHGKNTF